MLPNTLPRLRLAHLPTPLQKLNRFSEELGLDVYMKRDDYSGLELSGNKIRKLEFCLAEAKAQGADTVITCGAVQSNHCRATAFAGARLGFSVILVLVGEPPRKAEGNLFYDAASGASIIWAASPDEREQCMEAMAQACRSKGRHPYLIPLGASNAVGSQGYRLCFQEILEQEKELGLSFDAIALAVGSGGTYAGLWYENDRCGAEKQILGYSVSADCAAFTRDIRRIIQDMRRLEGLPPLLPEPEFQLNDAYVGAGYAKFTEEELRFLMETARREAVLLDPCYTGKAFRGLYQDLQSGRLTGLKRVLFLHTGGLYGWTEEARALAVKQVSWDSFRK